MNLSRVFFGVLFSATSLLVLGSTAAVASSASCPEYICGSIDTADDSFNVNGKRSLEFRPEKRGPKEKRAEEPSGKQQKQVQIDPNRIITITQVYCFTLGGVGQLDCFETERTRCTRPGSQLVIRAQYPANAIDAIERSGAPFCSTPADPVMDDPAASEAEAPPMPVVTLADFRRLDIAPSRIESDSGGFGLVRANTNFYATEETQSLDTTMLDQQVTIQAIPVQWTFDYGDGSAPLVSTTPGGPQREFNQQTTTSHAYQETGTFPVTVSTAYRGQFSVNGGPWIAIPGTASVPSAPAEADIWRSDTKNVAEDCHANPEGWACGDPFIED